MPGNSGRQRCPSAKARRREQVEEFHRTGQIPAMSDEEAERAARIGLIVGLPFLGVLVPLGIGIVIVGTGTQIVVGGVLVVLLGAAGLVLRGFGELQGSPRLKAWGYFSGATAYVATATVALITGLSALLKK